MHPALEYGEMIGGMGALAICAEPTRDGDQIFGQGK